MGCCAVASGCLATDGSEFPKLLRSQLRQRLVKIQGRERASMKTNLPEYVEKSVPVPRSSRVPWYSSTFPAYFGIFLWVGYYLKLAGSTIGYASPTIGLLGLLVAG